MYLDVVEAEEDDLCDALDDERQSLQNQLAMMVGWKEYYQHFLVVYNVFGKLRIPKHNWQGPRPGGNIITLSRG